MNATNPRRRSATHRLVQYILFAALAFSVTCSKPRDDTASKELPLLSTSGELQAATEKAGNRLVVLDLYADWCMPCKILAPILEELSREYANSAAFYRVNIDQSPDLARAFGVRGIPYIVFLKQNKAVYALTGVNPKDSYRKVLDICKGATSPDECVGRLNDRM